MNENKLKQAFLNGLGFAGLKQIEALDYKGYREDVKNFRSDLQKVSEKFKSRNVKK